MRRIPSAETFCPASIFKIIEDFPCKTPPCKTTSRFPSSAIILSKFKSVLRVCGTAPFHFAQAKSSTGQCLRIWEQPPLHKRLLRVGVAHQRPQQEGLKPLLATSIPHRARQALYRQRTDRPLRPFNGNQTLTRLPFLTSSETLPLKNSEYTLSPTTRAHKLNNTTVKTVNPCEDTIV